MLGCRDGTKTIMKRTISVIGSFKQHNEEIQRICGLFRGVDVTVTSPQGGDVIEEGVDFVRFHSDPPHASDATIQSVALHRILRSDLVFAVLPNGYIGRTTCYEVGRILQAKKPIYFSEHPLDFPVHIPDGFVMDAATLADRFRDPLWRPTWLFASDNTVEAELEIRLVEGDYLNE